MISAPVVRAVQELLTEKGIEPKQDERLADYVARGLDISEAEAEKFLECVHDGATIEQAQAQAGIRVDENKQTLLVSIARAIGSTLGRLT